MKPISSRIADAMPLSDMNTTPLIDVMLVLLIMMILNIPLRTHETPMHLPQETVAATQPPPHHQLGIGFDGHLTWDGTSLPAAELAARLRAIGSVPKASQAQLRIMPDGYAGYERVLRVLALAQTSHVENIAFVGTEAFANQ